MCGRVKHTNYYFYFCFFLLEKYYGVLSSPANITSMYSQYYHHSGAGNGQPSSANSIQHQLNHHSHSHAQQHQTIVSLNPLHHQNHIVERGSSTASSSSGTGNSSVSQPTQGNGQSSPLALPARTITSPITIPSSATLNRHLHNLNLPPVEITTSPIFSMGIMVPSSSNTTSSSRSSSSSPSSGNTGNSNNGGNNFSVSANNSNSTNNNNNSTTNDEHSPIAAML